MTTVVVPAKIESLPVMDSGVEAMSVTDDLRGAAVATSDVSTTMTGKGSPRGWDGDDADQADHEMTQLARDADVVSAALEEVTLGCDVYVSTMVELASDRDDLAADRLQLNSDIDDLVARVNRSTEDDVATLQAEATTLTNRAATLNGRITTWKGRIVSAEDRFIRVIRSVDTVGEGEQAADSPDRVDVEKLLAQLEGKKDPRAITTWWDSLTPEQQEALKVHSPEIVGNTNGIPAGDRDDANRGSLQQDLAHLNRLKDEGRLTDDQALQLKNAEAAQKGLDLGATRVDPNTGQLVDTNLLLYLPGAFDSDGVAAVAYGDPDTADNTAVVVPGITNDGSTIDSQGEDALRLFLESSQNGESTSVIAWMGYDSPSLTGDDLLETGLDMGSVINEQKSEQGGHLLSDFVAGLRATDDGERSHLSVVAHSYGSNVAAHAATDGLDADRLVLIGSPGAGGGSDHVSDLNMPPGTVYVGAADNDPVTWLGRDDHNGESDFFRNIPLNPFEGPGGLGLGEDPAQESFGAKRFEVDPGTELHYNTVHSDGIDNHTAYLDPGSTSLHNISEIVQGNEPTIVPGRTKDANGYLYDLAREEAREEAGKAYDRYIQEPIIDPVVEGTHRVVETGKDVVDGAVDTGRRVVDGAVDTGRRVVDGAVDTGREIYEGGRRVVESTVDTGQKVAEEAYETGQDIYEGGKKVVTDPIGTFKGVFGG
ncbi:hypothetical protein ncot_15750 [Nocardioides sp. JQ2195]|uniref:alpha/beta hydrolase n=1 Tax=Nocardioides sp. JQ2195 TaxID=2592334 RepID=UPI00143E7BDA|nr:alpha/beta hydrolase [Nocardioides sp. JQ2195]QIX27877.1 hypothetical protein ncot_15750 [Nocardioides sp. JQ2195]